MYDVYVIVLNCGQKPKTTSFWGLHRSGLTVIFIKNDNNKGLYNL